MISAAAMAMRSQACIGAGDALGFAFAPASVPEMEAERAIKKGGKDVGQKLNYNVDHPQILLEAHPPCSIT
jgi:hypothetical protein